MQTHKPHSLRAESLEEWLQTCASLRPVDDSLADRQGQKLKMSIWKITAIQMGSIIIFILFIFLFYLFIY